MEEQVVNRCKQYLLQTMLPYCCKHLHSHKIFENSRLKEQKSFMKQCIQVEPFSFYYAHYNLKQDPEMIKYVAEINPILLEFVNWNAISDHHNLFLYINDKTRGFLI